MAISRQFARHRHAVLSASCYIVRYVIYLGLCDISEFFGYLRCYADLLLALVEELETKPTIVVGTAHVVVHSLALGLKTGFL